jgi:glycine/D-amino acid oxidase-like deaminating enzyme
MSPPPGGSAASPARPARVVVIGAGVIGCSVALQVARAGARVALVEGAPAPGSGTTATTDAWINANAKRPYDYFRLSVRAVAAHRRLASEMEGGPWLLRTGCLEWATDGDDRARLEERARELEGWGYGVRRLSPSWVMRELEPDVLLPGGVDQVFFYPDECLAFPQLYLAHVLRACRSLGVELALGTPVREVVVGSGRARGVRLDDGARIAADVVVSCAGRWTPDLLAPLGVEVPLVSPAEPGSPALGFLVSTSPIAADVRRRLSCPEINLRPDGGGRLQLQGKREEREVRLDTPTTPLPPQAQRLVAKARGLLRHSAAMRAQAAMIGIRPLPADGLPVVGWAPSVEGLYVVVTHSGVTLAPLIGELASAEVAGGEQELLKPYRPSRFAPGSRLR